MQRLDNPDRAPAHGAYLVTPRDPVDVVGDTLRHVYGRPGLSPEMLVLLGRLEPDRSIDRRSPISA